MSAQELAGEIESLILSSVDTFALEVEEIQGRLYDRLLNILKDIETDSEGYIKQSSSNRRVLYDAENLINEYLPGESLTNAVSRALTVINEVDGVAGEYFSGISDKFNPNRNFVKSLQQQTISSIESHLLQDGLTASIKNPLIDILNQNVNSGGQFSGFLEQVQNFVKGNEELDGRLLSYSRTYLRDTLFIYARSYQQSFTKDLKLEFYMWAGGLIDTSRPFCIEHAGKYFHQKEIEEFANQTWAGKNPNTTESSIFTLAGGYGCAHSIVPVDESKVPAEVIERNRKNGNI